MVPAVRTGPQVLLEHRLEQRLAAAVALGPQPLGHLGAVGLGRLLDASAFALEPGHGVRGFSRWDGRPGGAFGPAGPRSAGEPTQSNTPGTSPPLEALCRSRR